MPGIRALSAALAAVACAAGLAACGGEDANDPIPADDGNQLLDQLDAIETAVREGNCERAQDLANIFAQDVNVLPIVEERELRNALVEASANLETLTQDQCEPATGATGDTGTLPTTTAPTTTTTTETTETTPEEPEDKESEGRGPPDRPPGGGNGNPGNGEDGGGSGDDDPSGGIGSDG